MEVSGTNKTKSYRFWPNSTAKKDEYPIYILLKDTAFIHLIH